MKCLLHNDLLSFVILYLSSYNQENLTRKICLQMRRPELWEVRKLIGDLKFAVLISQNCTLSTLSSNFTVSPCENNGRCISFPMLILLFMKDITQYTKCKVEDEKCQTIFLRPIPITIPRRSTDWCPRYTFVSTFSLASPVGDIISTFFFLWILGKIPLSRPVILVNLIGQV